MIDKIDYKDPDSGWGVREHTTVFPLTGKGVGMIPDDVKGYKMDSTCDGYSWNENYYSITHFLDTILSPSLKYNASVYCYVSEDFDGTSAYIKVKGNVEKRVTSRYDLERKGVWQKLDISFISTGGDVKIDLVFYRKNTSGF